MSILSSLGLRARLAIALVGLVVFAVGLATILANHGLQPRLSAAAQARLERSAAELALIAGDGYRHHGGWTTGDAQSLERFAAVNGLHVIISAPNGRVLALPDHNPDQLSGRPFAEAPVLVNARQVGSVRVTSTGSQLLSPEEVGLRHSLDTLHIVAGGVSVAVALVVAFVLAHTLSTPLRRTRLAAEALTRGDLKTRIPPGGGAELNALTHTLNQLAETLEREEALRKASVADLAHELRTPVGGLLSRIEAAQDRVLPDQAANLEAMHGEATRLTALLNDLSRLADAERPGMLVTKHPVDLADCAAQQLDAFAPQFAERGIALERDLMPAWVDGDAGRLGQIVANLLSNALRYTPSGGRTHVRVASGEKSSVLEISDSGIGIAESDLPHVFKRFWRAEKSRSRVTGGAGIGLAIVRELVHTHGGTTEVQSELGRGSTFRVSLPAGSSAEPDGRPSEEPWSADNAERPVGAG